MRVNKFSLLFIAGAVVVAMAMVAGKGMMDVSHGTLLDGRCATIKDISDLYLDRIVKLR